MGYIEVLIKIKSEKNIKELYGKIQKVDKESEDIDFFAVIKPKMNLDTKYKWANGSLGETLKANQLYAWIGGNRGFIRNNFNGTEVSPGIDKYLRLDDNGYLEKCFWENVFLKHYPVKHGVITDKEKIA